MSTTRGVTLIADKAATMALAPLVDVWEERTALRVEHMGVPGPAALARLAESSAAVLVVGPRSRSPRTVLPGSVVTTASGRVVPVAWLPDTGPADLRTFAEAAVRVHRRADGAESGRRRTFAVLGERHPRFDRLADRIVRLAAEDTSGVLTPTRWTAYDVDRNELVRRLGLGPGLAVYVGHGRPVGWVGYAGLRASHLVPGEPAGIVVSLTCKTASRRRTGLSFAEALPLRGSSAAALGAVGPTRHTSNARWAMHLTRAASTAATVGELAVAIAPYDPDAAAYRLLGDPTAPLLDPVDVPAQLVEA